MSRCTLIMTNIAAHHKEAKQDILSSVLGELLYVPSVSDFNDDGN